MSNAPLPKGRATRAESLQIGIAWECESCDIDLYARPFPGAPVLYFGHTQSPQGRYWKDYTNSPLLTNGQETIGFTVPVDLRTLTLAVNFYRGEAPGRAQGEIRIAVDDQTFALPFHLPAEIGNGGVGMASVLERSRATSTHWLVIDPMAVVGGGP